jgi:hypothetical protein
MTGAGTTSVVWTREDSYGTLPTGPTYVYPGRDVQVSSLELRNALQRSRLPDDNEAIEAVAQQLEGAYEIEYDLCHPWALTDVFVSEHTDSDSDGVLEWSMGAGQMPTSRWYIGVDVGSSTCERELKGAATTSLQVQISDGSNVRVSQTIVYGDEEKNSSMTPGSIEGGDQSPYVYHGGSLTVDGTTQKKMQEATLEITNNGSLDRGWNRKAIDAVAGDAEYNLSASKIVDDSLSSNVTLAYGNSTAPVSTSGIDGVSGELPLTRGDGDEITLSLTGVRPDTYGWDNIPPSGDERVQESIQFFVDVVTAEADVSMADPFA